MVTRRRRNSSQRLATQSFELALAAPQVIAHRLSRMTQAGATPSLRDRREFARMGHEKVWAFYQSGVAFWTEVWRAQWQMAQSLLTSGWSTALGVHPRRRPIGSPHATARLLSAGLAPVHATAVANARRLGGRSRRKARRT